MEKVYSQGMTVMTSSFNTRCFTESSFLTSLARFAVLPSIIAASLALAACQETSVPGENDTQEESTNEVDADAVSPDATLENDESKATEMSNEEQMIVNLTNYRWTLMSANDKGAQPLNMLLDIKDQVRLSFSQYQGENSLNYSVGCNTMSAGYQLQGQTLTIEDGMSTKMSCGELDKAENQLNQLMQGESQLTLVLDANVENGSAESATTESYKPVLTQITSDASTLVWEGKLTSQAKYNGKGETIFWAVNAKKAPCEDNGSEQCLQVKPIVYDDQGIKSSEGKWEAFKGEIDGYQHDGKHDEVIRLQRYQLDNSETADNVNRDDSEEYAYVLDAVIESSVVK